jgi:hypothetical protein
MRILKIEPYLSDIELKEKLHSQKSVKDFQSYLIIYFRFYRYLCGKRESKTKKQPSLRFFLFGKQTKIGKRYPNTKICSIFATQFISNELSKQVYGK